MIHSLGDVTFLRITVKLLDELRVCLCFQTDSVERFHITAFVLFVLAQNILEAEGPWFESFFIVSFFGNLSA